MGFNGNDGAQGPPGITTLNDTNTYLVTEEGVSNNSTSNVIGQAICDAEDFVINGGFELDGVSGGLTNIAEIINRAILVPFRFGWEVQLSHTSQQGQVSYTVYAICFDNPPAHIP